MTEEVTMTTDPLKLHKCDEPLSVESVYGVDLLLRKLREEHPEYDPRRLPAERAA